MKPEECKAQHDVFMQCPYCGWKRPQHEHQYTVVVEWERWDYKDEKGKISGQAGSQWPFHQKATKVMCPCGEIKEL